MEAKILIILSSDIFIRNYLTTNAFTEIEKLYECYYLLNKGITHHVQLKQKSNFLGYYKIDKKIEKKHLLIFNVLMYKFKHKSSSFKFRIKRSYHFTWNKNQSNSYSNIIKHFIWFILNLVKTNSIYFLLSRKFIYPLFENSIIKNLPNDKIIYDTIKKTNPSIVVFPSNAYSAEGIDIARICLNLHIPSLFLIDNWDNLSSKSIMWRKPDYLGVWGEQSVYHATNIQEFNKRNITIIGTPRFDEYFKSRDSSLESHFNFKYILFVGTALAFDEAGVLKIIDMIIKDNFTIFKDIKVVYRPHPWRQGFDTISTLNLSNVVIDPQLYLPYISGVKSEDVQPDINYYPSLIKNAEFVIGGLTTMIMEALIFRKKVLALAYDDNKNFTSPHNVLRYYVHFQGINEIEAINYCTDIKEIENIFIETWNSRLSVDKTKIDLQRNFFLFNDSKPYSTRLAELITKILTANTLNHSN